MVTLGRDLFSHMSKVRDGELRFENIFESLRRMILVENKVEKITTNGKSTFDFEVFRKGRKHPIGMYDELNSLVSFIKDAAEGGSSKEMAFVLVGEPGNGKTFLVEYLCKAYREFLSEPQNMRFSFQLNLPQNMKGYGRIDTIESQTYEDPMILAMNLFNTTDENKEFLSKKGFNDKQIERLYENYRSLGADTAFVLKDLKNLFNGDMNQIFDSIELFPVPLIESLGTVTGKYPAKDKITSSAADLLGQESVGRLLHLTKPGHPYLFDLRKGALARVAGGGIHFCDEMFKNKKDLIQVYLGVIQNRTIEIDGFKWPLDTLIIATSNNHEFNDFKGQNQEAPIVDRCRIVYVGHNTNYLLQDQLTRYCLGSKLKETFLNEKMHEDPNLNLALSVAVTLTRLPRSEKLTPEETMKLAAGEIAGDKSIKTLAEVVATLSQDPDITRRFGQKGIGQRNLGRTIQLMLESAETNEGKCLYAGDAFVALERIVLDYVSDANERTKFLEDIKLAAGIFKKQVRIAMFNAYMQQPDAIRRDVLNYVNMIIGIDAENLGQDKMWKYKDPQTNEIKGLKIDERYIKSVEERLGLKTDTQRESFRGSIRKIYGQKMSLKPDYDFMDNVELVDAVTNVRLKSDIGSAGSLIGALSNRSNEDNQKLYDRMLTTMTQKMGYCDTCAKKTIEYFCVKDEE